MLVSTLLVLLVLALWGVSICIKSIARALEDHTGTLPGYAAADGPTLSRSDIGSVTI
jgi:hypothetical protein